MVILLDGFLCILNILVENEVLTVGGVGVKMLTLTHFDRNNWSASGEALDQLILSDLSRDVLHE